MRVFLLLSRDGYPFDEGGLQPLCNADIDVAWREFYRAHRADRTMITLSDQLDGNNDIAAFRPLFCCTETRQFFHPACPRCGSELDLVRDDALLAASGLRPYSASLKRYLACAACLSMSGDKTFYAWRPEASDPACVKGFAELVRGLPALASPQVPCSGCPGRDACLSAGRAETRIAAIAFYPFYMLVFEAATLNAADFLALVSGASFDEVSQALLRQGSSCRAGCVDALKGRTRSPMLFTQGSRRFLEVLFLKLAFLGEVFQGMLFGPGDVPSGRTGPSLERLWVRIPEQNDLSCTFWSFSCTLMDMEPGIPDMPLGAGADRTARVMAMLWFHVLLRNRSQDIRSVNEALAHSLKESRMDPDAPALQARNTLWDRSDVPVRYAGFWEKALRVGWSLLTSQGSGLSSLEESVRACRELMDSVRSELFSEAPAAADAPAPAREGAAPGVHDEQIAGVLGRIRSRWEGQLQAPGQEEPSVQHAPVPQPPPESREEKAGEATVVIAPAVKGGPGEGEEYSRTVAMKPRGAGVPEEDDFRTETVIMRHAPEASVPRDAGMADETVVMGAPRREADPKVLPDAAEPARDDLSATIAMGATASPPARDVRSDSDLDATVAMGARPAPATPASAPAGKEDELAETVIMKPDKKK